MRYLIFFFIIQFVSPTSNAQKDLNLGEVSYDSLFHCNDSLRRGLNERWYNRPANERGYNIPAICDSKNDIEIRLNGFSSPRTSKEFIIFSYKDGKWEAKKYTTNTFGKNGPKQTIISLNFSIYDGMYPEYHPCILILNHLIDNKIFLVPDQSKSIPDEYLGHGIFLTLSFKTKDLYRTYSFKHPDSYLQEHPDNKEYIYIKEIIKTLQEIFD